MRFMGNRRQTRYMALAFLLCFVVISLFSAWFMLTHAGHEHDHHGADDTCVVCVQLRCIENTLKQYGAVWFVMAATLAGLFVVAVLTGNAFANRTRFTPVTLQIKLNQ